MTAAQVGLVPAIHSFFCHWNPTYRADAMGRALRYALPLLVVLALALGAHGPAKAAGPEGQLTWGVHISLAPTWFDPAEHAGIITPYMVLYALHDAIAKDMPGKTMAPSLAESWTASEDGRRHACSWPARDIQVGAAYA